MCNKEERERESQSDQSIVKAHTRTQMQDLELKSALCCNLGLRSGNNTKEVGHLKKESKDQQVE